MEQTKLYQRVGRRFVQIPNYVGMFYNKSGTFTREKTADSIAVCVNQTMEGVTVCSLKACRSVISWHAAKNVAKSILEGGRLPTYEELPLIFKYKTLLNDFPYRCWSSTECGSNSAFSLYLITGCTCYSSRDCNYDSIFTFLDIPYKELRSFPSLP